jgi:hypothetical protein
MPRMPISGVFKKDEPVTYVGVECNILYITRKAMLVDIDGVERWIPFSCIKVPHDLGPSTVHIAKWLLDREGLIDHRSAVQTARS